MRVSFWTQMAEFARKTIEAEIEKTGSVTAAAKSLQLNRTHLHHLCNKYGVKKRESKRRESKGMRPSRGNSAQYH
jgi:DNA-binding NtrC family response regulator